MTTHTIRFLLQVFVRAIARRGASSKPDFPDFVPLRAAYRAAPSLARVRPACRPESISAAPVN